MEFRDWLQNRRPRLLQGDGLRFASVALLLQGADADARILFIERACRAADPWSGQVAFPGGNYEPDDPDVLHTAVREVQEEVGINLSAAHCIGRLDDQQSQPDHRPPLVISCFVFQLQTEHRLAHSDEVAASFWVNLDHLRAPGNRIHYQHGHSATPYPGVQLDHNRVLWGLTYRFVNNFLALAP